jgi:hypothetical protein
MVPKLSCLLNRVWCFREDCELGAFKLNNLGRCSAKFRNSWYVISHYKYRQKFGRIYKVSAFRILSQKGNIELPYSCTQEFRTQLDFSSLPDKIPHAENLH